MSRTADRRRIRTFADRACSPRGKGAAGDRGGQFSARAGCAGADALARLRIVRLARGAGGAALPPAARLAGRQTARVAASYPGRGTYFAPAGPGIARLALVAGAVALPPAAGLVDRAAGIAARRREHRAVLCLLLLPLLLSVPGPRFSEPQPSQCATESHAAQPGQQSAARGAAGEDLGEAIDWLASMASSKELARPPGLAAAIGPRPGRVRRARTGR